MAMQKQLLSAYPMHEMPCLTAAARRGGGREGGRKNRFFSFFSFFHPPFLFTLL